MSSRALARRLERLETTLSPTSKPGITVIVTGLGGPEEIFHVPDLGRSHNERQGVKERAADNWTHTPDNA